MSNRARPILDTLSPAELEKLKARLTGIADRSAGPDACWPYLPPPTGGSFTHGYPVIYTTTSAKTRRLVKLHRLIFEIGTGQSPPSVDHRCHDSDACRLAADCPHRRCCNPAHLEASTVGANAARARKGVYRHEGLCGAGLHPRNEENTYEAPDGSLRCRPCDAKRAREARIKQLRPRTPARHYRPRGLSLEQLADWALPADPATDCCYWPGLEPGTDGYTNVSFQGRRFGAHILIHRARIGPVPDGHVVDHVCHDPRRCAGGFGCPHRSCINPAHLKAVPRGANSSAERSRRRRPTHCHQGHEFTPENTRVGKGGRRICKTCARERAAEDYREGRKGRADARYRADGKCSNGHVIAEVGVNQYGRCKACRRETSRRYKAKQARPEAE